MVEVKLGEATLLYSFYGLLPAYTATLFLGVPTHLILRSIGKATVSAHAAVGATLGLLIWLFMVIVGRAVSADGQELIIGLGLFVLPSLSVAAAFGAITKYTKPDYWSPNSS